MKWQRSFLPLAALVSLLVTWRGAGFAAAPFPRAGDAGVLGVQAGDEAGRLWLGTEAGLSEFFAPFTAYLPLVLGIRP